MGGGDGPIELCVMEAVSPAANPRQTWKRTAQQAAAGAPVPYAVYPFKRADWFVKVFAQEEAVRAAARRRSNKIPARSADAEAGVEASTSLKFSWEAMS